MVADSGSSKTDWRIVHPSGTVESRTSAGLNPMVISADHLCATVENCFEDFPEREQVHHVYFYGAGCSTEMRCAQVRTALQPTFPHAQLHVEHDLYGAARAVCQGNDGLVCILGTGSSSCLYVADKIEDRITALGYLAGDEGSGNHIGRALLQAYFYREMPDDLSKAFEDFTDPEPFRQLLYNSDRPNFELARLSRFAGEQRHHPFVKNLVQSCFISFSERHLLKYKTDLRTVYAVGSIAFHFRDWLEDSFQTLGLTLGSVIDKPIDPLVTFHARTH
ncbi:MAG: hypothetical protein F6K11_11315 [Leptolyngbya sp. SIO3F4]|nr:hypothetical protein [Leptolyngbya sp. SIO3F4]